MVWRLDFMVHASLSCRSYIFVEPVCYTLCIIIDVVRCCYCVYLCVHDFIMSSIALLKWSALGAANTKGVIVVCFSVNWLWPDTGLFLCSHCRHVCVCAWVNAFLGLKSLLSSVNFDVKLFGYFRWKELTLLTELYVICVSLKLHSYLYFDYFQA